MSKEKPRNQRDDVLEFLKNHGSITQLDAYKYFPAPITRLSAVIYDLRKAGHNIESVDCIGKNCYGTNRYTNYTLIKEK